VALKTRQRSSSASCLATGPPWRSLCSPSPLLPLVLSALLLHSQGGGGHAHAVPRPADGGLSGGVAATSGDGGDPASPPPRGCSPP